MKVTTRRMMNTANSVASDIPVRTRFMRSESFVLGLFNSFPVLLIYNMSKIGHIYFTI